MIQYVETSLMLSILLGDVHAPTAIKVWHSSADRFSSILTEIETMIVLRRFASRNPRLPKAWLTGREAQATAMFAEINVIDLDHRIREMIRAKARLAECRSLDAIHVGTLLWIQQRTDERVQMASFDERIRATARMLRIKNAV